MSTRRLGSAASLWPQAADSGPEPPKVPVPKLSAGTRRPEDPSCRYYMPRLIQLRFRCIDGKKGTGLLAGLNAKDFCIGRKDGRRGSCAVARDIRGGGGRGQLLRGGARARADAVRGQPGDRPDRG